MALALDATAVAHVERVLACDRSRMPLHEALTRRLGAASWTLTLGPDGRLRAVIVLGDAPPPAPPAPPPPVASPLDRELALPPAGVLARLLGARTASARQLADLALRQDDPAIRGEAAAVAVEALVNDPALERDLLAALGDLDDGALAAALAGVAGEAAPALAALVADRARGRPLGRRAAAVLRRLGGP